MAKPKGHSLDSFVTGAWGPDLWGALGTSSGSALVQVFYQDFIKFHVYAWAACH